MECDWDGQGRRLRLYKEREKVAFLHQDIEPQVSFCFVVVVVFFYSGLS